MDILVTGSNGFIGQRLAARLKLRGHKVVGLTHLQQDITQPFSLNQSFDLGIHLAAYNVTHVGLRDVETYEAVNVRGTEHVIKAMGDVKRFIYLSTTKVYKNEGLALRENSPTAAQGAYEQSKLRGEDVCRRLLKKEALVILRSVNVVGWGQALKAVLPVFFQKAHAHQDLDIIHPPQTQMQFVYVEDLIDAIEAVINNDRAAGIFNIAHQEPVTLEQLAQQIIAVTHSSSKVNIKTQEQPPALGLVDCSQAWELLKWKAKTGIRSILEEYEQNFNLRHSAAS